MLGEIRVCEGRNREEVRRESIKNIIGSRRHLFRCRRMVIVRIGRRSFSIY